MCEQRQLKSALLGPYSSAALPAAAVPFAVGGPPDRGLGAVDPSAVVYAAAAAPGRGGREAPPPFTDKDLFRYL